MDMLVHAHNSKFRSLKQEDWDFEPNLDNLAM